MVCLYRCRLLLLLDCPGWLLAWLFVHDSVIAPFDSPFVVDHHGMHVGRSFSVVGNKLKLNIMLGSEVDLYTAIIGPWAYIQQYRPGKEVYIRYIYYTCDIDQRCCQVYIYNSLTYQKPQVCYLSYPTFSQCCFYKNNWYMKNDNW